MSHLRVRSLQDSDAAISRRDIDMLRARLGGVILEPADPGYEAARTVWNGMIDRRPALIVQCASAQDVSHAVSLCFLNGLHTAIKGGGHHIAGLGVCDGGVVIDLSLMRGVTVDPAARTVLVDPGATLAAVDAATAPHGLVVPTGINSTTGIAGLTLGGGFGWTSRSFGLTIDNLEWAEVVLADGRLLRASASEEPDLFWAIRGGSGNFGVVTRFCFRAHPMPATVLAGLIVHPFEVAHQVLEQFRTCAASAPDQLTTWAIVRKAPPLPFLPVEWHGRKVVVLAMCYAGDPADGELAVLPVKAIGAPIGQHIGPMPFTAWQQAFDPLLQPGARNYWKSHDFARLSDGLVDVLLDHAMRLPSDETEIFLGHLGAAVRRVPDDATAYGARDAEFIVNVHGRWRDAADDDRVVSWARKLYDAMTPEATGSAYINFMTGDETARIATAYRGNYARLAALKLRFDPQNLFRANQNIRPAGV